MNIALTVNSTSNKYTRLSLDSNYNVHMTYDQFLFSKYSEVLLSLIWMDQNWKLRIPGRSAVSFIVRIDNEAFQAHFLNVLHSPDLEYNLLLLGTIEEAGYLVLDKNKKMTVFDNENNVALLETQIGTGYLVDISCDETYQALFSSHSPSQNYAL